MTEPSRISAPLVIEYPFTRTTGPVIGAFLTGLRERIILGVRRADGSVLVPPTEYDPQTSEPLGELVEVGQQGTVVSWTWSPTARPQQRWGRPIGWGLVLLDGADTPMMHALLVDGPEHLSTGMRVEARWREDREGQINDLEGFVPVSRP